MNYQMNKKEIGRLVEDVTNRYPLADVPEILDGLKATGYHYATRAGITVSVYDATVPLTGPRRSPPSCPPPTTRSQPSTRTTRWA